MAAIETKTQRKNESENGLVSKSRQQDDHLQGSEQAIAPFTLQPQLEIGAPDDKLEQEAESTADKVMLMPEEDT